MISNSEIVSKLKELDFFSKSDRTISDSDDVIAANNYMIHVLYDDPICPDVISSIMVLRGGYRDEADRDLPGYGMITTKNAIVKYDVDEGKTVVTVAAVDGHPGCTVEFDGTVGEDAFFQESIVTDMGAVSYEFVKLANDVVHLIRELELAGDLA